MKRINLFHISAIAAVIFIGSVHARLEEESDFDDTETYTEPIEKEAFATPFEREHGRLQHEHELEEEDLVEHQKAEPSDSNNQLDDDSDE